MNEANSTQDLLADSIEGLMADHSTPAVVRRAEAGGLDRALWDLLSASGYDKALLSEAGGGLGLSLADIGPVLVSCGRHVAPVPLGEAMLGRAYAEAAGVALPEGPGTVALARIEVEQVVAQAAPCALGAEWVLAIVPGADSYVFESTAMERGERSGLSSGFEPDLRARRAEALLRFSPPNDASWLSAGAAIRTAQIAGGLDALLEMTLKYANDRQQFGRPIAKFQAIQQEIAVLAEHTFMARMAASSACNSAGPLPRPDRVGPAKATASEAAAVACRIAHSVHGAMGITEEYDLQLYTGRLLAWRMQYGSEAYWCRRLGEELLKDSRSVWSFVRRA